MTQRKTSIRLMGHIAAALLFISLQPSARAQDSFAGDGVILGDTVGSMAIATDADSVYVSGAERIEKRGLSDGALVPGFGVGGILGIAGPDEPRALAIASGSLFIVGADQAWRIDKRDSSDGSPASSFGTLGVITRPDDVTANAIAVAGEFIYVAGMGDSGWRIEKRSLSDGGLIPGFGDGGAVMGPELGEPMAIAVRGESLLVAGQDDVACWRIEKRNVSDGMLQYAVTEPCTCDGCNEPQAVLAIATDPGSMYLAGELGGKWRIERRSISDGALVYAQELPSGTARAVAINSTFMFVAGQFAARDSLYLWRVDKRYLSDGTLVSHFGRSGSVTSRAEIANGIAIDPQFMYVAGEGNTPNWRLEKRTLSSGAFATTGRGPECRAVCQDAYLTALKDQCAMDCASLAIDHRSRCTAPSGTRLVQRCISERCAPAAARCTVAGECASDCRESAATEGARCEHIFMRQLRKSCGNSSSCVVDARAKRRECRKSCRRGEHRPSAVAERTGPCARASQEQCVFGIVSNCYAQCKDVCENDALALSICRRGCRNVQCGTLLDACTDTRPPRPTGANYRAHCVACGDCEERLSERFACNIVTTTSTTTTTSSTTSTVRR